MTMDDLILAPLFAVLRIAQPFRKERTVTPPHPRLTRDYEWHEDRFCLSCKATTSHLHIEWVEQGTRPVTAECEECGEETELL